MRAFMVATFPVPYSNFMGTIKKDIGVNDIRADEGSVLVILVFIGASQPFETRMKKEQIINIL